MRCLQSAYTSTRRLSIKEAVTIVLVSLVSHCRRSLFWDVSWALQKKSKTHYEISAKCLERQTALERIVGMLYDGHDCLIWPTSSSKIFMPSPWHRECLPVQCEMILRDWDICKQISRRYIAVEQSCLPSVMLASSSHTKWIMTGEEHTCHLKNYWSSYGRMWLDFSHAWSHLCYACLGHWTGTWAQAEECSAVQFL